jgi:hypothetical protein
MCVENRRFVKKMDCLHRKNVSYVEKVTCVENGRFISKYAENGSNAQTASCLCQEKRILCVENGWACYSWYLLDSLVK